jgi:acyl carrier protein
MSEDIYDKLTTLFRDVLDDESVTLTPSTTAKDVHGWDSLAHVQLMLSVERQFKIKLSASKIGKLKSVGDLVNLIEQTPQR